MSIYLLCRVIEKQGLVLSFPEPTSSKVTYTLIDSLIHSYTHTPITGKWLDPVTYPPANNTREAVVSYIGTVCVSLLVFVFCAANYYTTGSVVSPFNVFSYYVGIVPFMLFASVLYGVSCVFISYAALSIFQRCCDIETATTRFLSESAYTVYIIHPWVIDVVAYTWALILQYGYGVEVAFPSYLDGYTSNTSFGETGDLH